MRFQDGNYLGEVKLGDLYSGRAPFKEFERRHIPEVQNLTQFGESLSRFRRQLVSEGTPIFK